MAKMSESNKYKLFVKEAKKRLTSGKYQELININKTGIGAKSYIINSRVVTGDELYSYYKRIVEMHQRDDISGAIGKLIDKSIYDNLTPAEQQRYVLTTARLYRDLKDEYDRQQQVGEIRML